eukprot:scaffold20566_cov135-Isochrysis_galbana.AAC.5
MSTCAYPRPGTASATSSRVGANCLAFGQPGSCISNTTLSRCMMSSRIAFASSSLSASAATACVNTPNQYGKHGITARDGLSAARRSAAALPLTTPLTCITYKNRHPPTQGAALFTEEIKQLQTLLTLQPTTRTAGDTP